MTAWDTNAARRYTQITSGIDLSYDHVLVPGIFRLLPQPGGRWRRLLDVGCGPGMVTKEASSLGWDAVGVDGSKAMIDLASQAAKRSTGLEFTQCSFANLADVFANKRFDAVVANMSLTGVLDIHSTIANIRRITRRGGLLVVSDVHPWFWRLYKGHADLPYWDSVTLYEPFTISLDRDPLPDETPVVYRPLAELVRAITQNGYHIDDIHEPRPNSEVEGLYPAPWDYPRFIFISACAK